MPYISRCIINDLAGRSVPVELNLNRHVNVFFGSNGSGKTSLLRLLHSALSNDSKQLVKIPVSSGMVEISEAPVDHTEWTIDYQNILRVIELQQKELFDEPRALATRALSSNKPVRKVWVSSSDLEGSEDAGQALEHVFLPITRLYATEARLAGIRRHVEPNAHLSESDLDRLFVESINLLWLRYTRNLLADVRRAQEEGLNNILYNILSPSESEAPQIEDPKLAFKRLVSFVSRQDAYMLDFYDEEDFASRINKSDLMRNVVADIERVEVRVEKAQRPRNQFEKLIRSLIGGNKTFELGDRDISFETHGGGKIDLGDLSSGEKQLLRIFLEALFAGENPIIIDEPELSMHIDWQRKFIRSLRLLSPDSQIIIATHSPEIMADLSEESIFEL